jgi:hypothetical protein
VPMNALSATLVSTVAQRALSKKHSVCATLGIRQGSSAAIVVAPLSSTF